MAGKCALVIQAHPDDMEYHCGGTVAGLVADGCRVSTLIMTDGSKGTYDPEMTPEKLAATRKKEAEDSAAVLGVSDAYAQIAHGFFARHRTLITNSTGILVPWQARFSTLAFRRTVDAGYSRVVPACRCSSPGHSQPLCP